MGLLVGGWLDGSQGSGRYYRAPYNDNKGIRDAGSTADFRILFEIFETLEIFDFFETFKFFKFLNFL